MAALEGIMEDKAPLLGPAGALGATLPLPAVLRDAIPRLGGERELTGKLSVGVFPHMYQ